MCWVTVIDFLVEDVGDGAPAEKAAEARGCGRPFPIPSNCKSSGAINGRDGGVGDGEAGSSKY